MGFFAVIALINNFHGHYIMNTTAGSCNTKMYFVSRFLLQGLYIYLSLTLVANKTLKWEALNEDVNRNEV